MTAVTTGLPARRGLYDPAQEHDACGVAFVTGFLPADAEEAAEARALIEAIAAEEGLTVLGWRDVPVKPELLGSQALRAMPTFSQLFVASTEGHLGMALERRAYCLRKRAEGETGAYFPSLSSRTIVYKGMLTTDQLDTFYPDL